MFKNYFKKCSVLWTLWTTYKDVPNCTVVTKTMSIQWQPDKYSLFSGRKLAKYQQVTSMGANWILLEHIQLIISNRKDTYLLTITNSSQTPWKAVQSGCNAGSEEGGSRDITEKHNVSFRAKPYYPTAVHKCINVHTNCWLIRQRTATTTTTYFQ